MSDTPDLASAANALADGVMAQFDAVPSWDREQLLRAAGRVFAALAAHDQQGDPDDDEPEQVQLAMVPLPGNGRYSVTVEHQADRGEDHYQTQEWEVWAKDGNVRVEPMTYPEPGVSDTPEPPPEPCKTCQDRGWVWEGNASAGEGTPADCPDPVHASDYASAGNPPVELTGGLDELLARADRRALRAANEGIAMADRIEPVSMPATPEGGELDDLLARVDAALPLMREIGNDGPAGLVADLAAALRRQHHEVADLRRGIKARRNKTAHARRKAREEQQNAARLAAKVERLERGLAEWESLAERTLDENVALTAELDDLKRPSARSHGEVLAREVTQALPDRDEPELSFVFTDLAVNCPPGTEVLVVRPVEDTDTETNDVD